MSPWLELTALGVIALAASAAILRSLCRPSPHPDAWLQAIADQYRGEVRIEAERPLLAFRRRDFDAQVDILDAGASGGLCFSARPVDRFPGPVRICSRGRLSERFQTSSPVTTGDDVFDERFAVGAESLSTALRILDPLVRREILQLSHEGTLLLSVTPVSLQLRLWIVTWNDDTLRRAVESVVAAGLEIARRLPAETAGDGVEVLSTSTGPGLCPVCSTSLADAVVSCALCATPHHRDCWLFNGRCGTYGCGSTDIRVP